MENTLNRVNVCAGERDARSWRDIKRERQHRNERPIKANTRRKKNGTETEMI